MALTWDEVTDLMQPAGGLDLTLADLYPLRPAWQAAGSCRSPHPLADWFPKRGRTAGPAIEAARAVCAGCPSREPCLDYAMANPELVGVWAGTTGKERRAMRRRGGGHPLGNSAGTQ